MWNALTRVGVVGVSVVIVAHEIETALDLGRRVRSEQGRVRRLVGAGRGRVERGGGARPTEVGVGVIDTGVDDGDLDAFAVHAIDAIPYLRRADVRHALRVVDVVDARRLDRAHARQARQRRSVAGGDAHGESVE